MRAVTSLEFTSPSPFTSQRLVGYDSVPRRWLMRAVASVAFTSPSPLMSPITGFSVR